MSEPISFNVRKIIVGPVIIEISERLDACTGKVCGYAWSATATMEGYARLAKDMGQATTYALEGVRNRVEEILESLKQATP
jgi:hypothetical protein